MNGRQEVSYGKGCSPQTKYFSCGSATTTKQAPSRFVGCTNTYHLGKWQPWEYTSTGGQIPYGNIKIAYASQCTANPPPGTVGNPGCTPNGKLTQHFLGCVSNGVGQFDWVNSCGSVMSTSTGAATRCDTGSSTGGAGSGSRGGSGSGTGGSGQTCTITTTYGTPQWTGCSAKGVETGYQPWTAKNSCGGTTSGTNSIVQHTSTTCQPTVAHQCAYAKPGYAQQRNCLTSPQGGYTDCGNWSAPYYDTYDCPIPTPIGN